VVGISEDGSYVYFSAAGQLVPGQGHTEAENTTNKEANVFAYHEGTLSYVATITNTEAGVLGGGALASEMVDAINGELGLLYMAARVSPNGQYLLLASKRKLTAYDNRDAESGKAEDYLYEYHYTTGAPAVTCVSCNPSGARVHSAAAEDTNLYGALGPYRENRAGGIVHNLLDDGRVFFTADGALAPATQTPGTLHAYEFVPAGVEGCVPLAPPEGTEPFEEGCVGLLDNGLSAFPTYLVGASEDGENVYITTPEKLDEGDGDTIRDLYDARVDGGRYHPPVSPECEENGVDCQTEKGSELDKGKRASEHEGEGNPPLGPPMAKKEVEAETTGSVGIKSHSHKGSTITLVVAAPGKGTITASGSGVSTLRRSAATEGNYTLKLTLGKKARTAVKHHKKLKVKVKISFVPMLGKSSSMTITITV
jgi:hypothetical protein